jgi:hypothetical protein
MRFSIGSPIQTAGSDGVSRDMLLEQIREAIRANLTFEEAGGSLKVAPDIKSDDLHDEGNLCRNA